jgi:hypothetical protein
MPRSTPVSMGSVPPRVLYLLKYVYQHQDEHGRVPWKAIPAWFKPDVIEGGGWAC